MTGRGKRVSGIRFTIYLISMLALSTATVRAQQPFGLPNPGFGKGQSDLEILAAFRAAQAKAERDADFANKQAQIEFQKQKAALELQLRQNDEKRKEKIAEVTKDANQRTASQFETTVKEYEKKREIPANEKIMFNLPDKAHPIEGLKGSLLRSKVRDGNIPIDGAVIASQFRMDIATDAPPKADPFARFAKYLDGQSEAATAYAEESKTKAQQIVYLGEGEKIYKRAIDAMKTETAKEVIPKTYQDLIAREPDRLIAKTGLKLADDIFLPNPTSDTQHRKDNEKAAQPRPTQLAGAEDKKYKIALEVFGREMDAVPDFLNKAAV